MGQTRKISVSLWRHSRNAVKIGSNDEDNCQDALGTGSLSAKMALNKDIPKFLLKTGWTITYYYKLGHIKKLQKSDSGRDWLRSEIQKRVQFFWWVDKNPRSEQDQKRKGNAKKTAPDSTVKKQKDKTSKPQQ